MVLKRTGNYVIVPEYLEYYDDSEKALLVWTENIEEIEELGLRIDTERICAVASDAIGLDAGLDFLICEYSNYNKGARAPEHGEDGTDRGGVERDGMRRSIKSAQH
jgi:hypothetical protein